MGRFVSDSWICLYLFSFSLFLQITYSVTYRPLSRCAHIWRNVYLFTCDVYSARRLTCHILFMAMKRIENVVLFEGTDKQRLLFEHNNTRQYSEKRSIGTIPLVRSWRYVKVKDLNSMTASYNGTRSFAIDCIGI
jgi:hypothetical protein